MLQILGRNLLNTLHCSSNIRALIFQKQMMKIRLPFLGYCSDADALQSDHLNPSPKKRHNLIRNSYKYGEDGIKTSEPDFLMNHLKKNRAKDDLSYILYSIRCYRKIMNSWHIIEVLEQLTEWSSKRQNSSQYILDDRDFQYFSSNIEYLTRFMTSKQILKTLHLLCKIRIDKTNHPLVLSVLSRLTENMNDLGIDDLFFLNFVLRKNFTRYRKRNVYIQLGSCLSKELQTINTSLYSRDKLTTILTILGECQVDGAGVVIKALFDEDESLDASFQTINEILAVLKCYKLLDPSEKLMADVLIKENITKVANNMAGFSVGSIFVLLRYITLACAEGHTVSYSENFFHSAMELFITKCINVKELLDIFKHIRKVDYFSEDFYIHMLRIIKEKPHYITKSDVIFNVRLITGSSMALSNNRELQDDLMFIVDEAVREMQSQEELLPIMQDEIEEMSDLSSSDDSSDSESESSLSEESIINRHTERKVHKLLMIALNLALIDLKSTELLKIITNHFNEFISQYNEKSDERSVLVFLYKLYDFYEKFWNIKLDINATLLDKAQNSMSLIINKSVQFEELISNTFVEDDQYYMNVTYDSVLLPVLLVVDEDNKLVPSNCVKDKDSVISFNDLDIQPGHKKIVIMELPPNGYNFDASTSSILDKKLLENAGFTVVSFSRLQTDDIEENQKLLKSRLNSIDVNL